MRHSQALQNNYSMADASKEIAQEAPRELPCVGDNDRLNSIVNIFKGVEEFILDSLGKIVSSNLEAVTITGYEEWEVMGRHFSIFYSVEDQIKRTFEDDLEKAARQGFCYTSGVKMKKRNSPFWAKMKIEAISDGSEIVSGYRVTIQDSTHKAIYSHNLNLVRDEYLNLFNNPFVGIFKFRLSDFKILMANEKAESLFGKGWSKNYLDSFFIDAAKFKSLIHALTSKGKVEDYEFEIINPRGGRSWVTLSCKHFSSVGFVEGIVLDITDRKREIERSLGLSNELEAFIYHASHDLRSPITSIYGLVNLLMRDSTESKVIEYSKLIEGRVNHLDYILRDIVEIAFNTAAPVEIASIDLESELALIVRSQSKLFPIIKSDVQVNISEGQIFKNDLTRVRSILRNIISNAFKYNNASASQTVSIKATVTESKVTIIIQDNGIGIPLEYQDKIFSLFYKATESHKGNGLGLSIVQSMLTRLRGDLTLDSSPGKGSIFKVTIPNNPLPSEIN
jgi:PAS domain S-box-containing protein